MANVEGDWAEGVILLNEIRKREHTWNNQGDVRKNQSCSIFSDNFDFFSDNFD